MKIKGNRILFSTILGIVSGLTIYYFFIQIQAATSLKRLGLGFIAVLGIAVAAFFVWPLFDKIYRKQSRLDKIAVNLASLLFTVVVLVNYSSLSDGIAENLLLVPTEISFLVPSGGSAVGISWLNVGYRDVDFDEIQVSNGAAEITESQVIFTPQDDQTMTIKWKGIVWKKIRGVMEGMENLTPISILIDGKKVNEMVTNDRNEIASFKFNIPPSFLSMLFPKVIMSLFTFFMIDIAFYIFSNFVTRTSAQDNG